MAGFGATPVTAGQGSLPSNQVPISSVAEPGLSGANLTALEAGPGTVDSNGNRTAPASMYMKDGGSVTLGLTTDTAVTGDSTGTASAKLRGLTKILGDIWDSVNHRIKVDGSGVTQPVNFPAAQHVIVDSGAGAGTQYTDAGAPPTNPIGTALIYDNSGAWVDTGIDAPLPVKFVAAQHAIVDSGTVTANAGTNLNTSLLALEAGGNLATINTNTANIPAKGQALAAASTPVVLTALQQTALTPPAAITGFTLEAGHIATIDTSTAASKADLDTIVTNTNKIPASPAQEGGNLATLAGIVSSSKAAVKSASGDFVDGSIVAIGTTTQTKATDGTTTSWSLVQLLKGILDRLFNGTIGVTGTFWQATQPISGAITQGAGAAAGTTWRTAGDFTEVTGLSAAADNADLVPSTDMSQYQWGLLHITGSAYVGTITFGYSNDNITFIPQNVYNLVSDSAGGGILSVTSISGTMYAIFKKGRFFRARMHPYTSGTAQGVIEWYTTAPPLYLSTLFAAQSGAWSLSASASGGATDFHVISAASTNATSVKASAGTLLGYEIYNGNAAVRYVKLYNKASAPTVGTDPVFRTIGVPPNSRAFYESTTGAAMATGIAFATTTGIADSDSTAVGLSDLSIDLEYK